MKKSKKYYLGQVFAIPLETCFAIGIIVRQKNEILLGYFHKQKFEQMPVLEDIEWKSDDFIMIRRFGSRGLDKGSWISLGVLPNFNLSNWKLPVFKRKDLLDGKNYKVYYDDELNEIKVELMEQSENPDEYFDDGLAGYGFVEKRLTRLLEC